MKIFYYYFFVPILFISMFFTRPAFAEYITYSGHIATLDSFETAGGNCKAGVGIVHDSSSGAGCMLYVRIDVPNGKTLETVKVYYYDNSGSQGIIAYLRSVALNSSSYTTLASASDSSTSSSVQTSTLTYGGTVSSSYSYFVVIYLTKDTEYRGLQVYYE